MTSRGSSYSVRVDPVHIAPADKDKPLTDWRWLTISDINGAGLHVVMVREKDLPQEIAIGVERAIMSHYDAIRPAREKR